MKHIVAKISAGAHVGHYAMSSDTGDSYITQNQDDALQFATQEDAISRAHDLNQEYALENGEGFFGTSVD